MSSSEIRACRDRKELAQAMARRIAVEVRAIAPAGLGYWAPTWDIVGHPMDAALDAIHAWEAAADGSDQEEELRGAVNVAATAALAAWRKAARMWEEAGRPGAYAEIARDMEEVAHAG